MEPAPRKSRLRELLWVIAVAVALLVGGYLTLLRAAGVATAQSPQSSASKSKQSDGKLKPEDASPNRISVGEVYTGATVEGRVRIYQNGNDTTGLSAKVDPPPFVKLKDVILGTQDYGGHPKIFCDIALSINTCRAGDLVGTLHVTVGDQNADIPVSATVLPAKPGLRRVLIAGSPFGSASDATTFDPWLKIVKEAKLNVDYLDLKYGQPVLRNNDLAQFDVIFLADGVVYLQQQDIENLRNYLAHGGRVIVVASNFLVDSIKKANEFIFPYGLQMVKSELRGPFVLKDDDIFKSPLTEGVKRINVSRPSPTVITNTSTQRIVVAYPKVPIDAFEALVAVTKADKGEIVVLGVSIWWAWIGGDGATDSDNARLLQNLLTVPIRIEGEMFDAGRPGQSVN